MIDPAEIVIFVVTLLFVGLCVASDVRTLRIPNALTGPAMLVGVALNAWCFGWHGAQLSVAGLGLAIVLLIGPFALGGIGAGDVKMMGAVGTFIGPTLLLLSLVVGLALGGVFAVAHLARQARLQEKLGSLGRMLGNAVMMLSLEPLKVSAAAPGAVVLPYSLPLGLGTLCVLVSAVAKS